MIERLNHQFQDESPEDTTTEPYKLRMTPYLKSYIEREIYGAPTPEIKEHRRELVIKELIREARMINETCRAAVLRRAQIKK